MSLVKKMYFHNAITYNTNLYKIIVSNDPKIIFFSQLYQYLKIVCVYGIFQYLEKPSIAVG